MRTLPRNQAARSFGTLMIQYAALFGPAQRSKPQPNTADSERRARTQFDAAATICRRSRMDQGSSPGPPHPRCALSHTSVCTDTHIVFRVSASGNRPDRGGSSRQRSPQQVRPHRRRRRAITVVVSADPPSDNAAPVYSSSKIREAPTTPRRHMTLRREYNRDPGTPCFSRLHNRPKQAGRENNCSDEGLRGDSLTSEATESRPEYLPQWM